MDYTGGLCCVPGCELKADEVHHIIERRTWQNPHLSIKNGNDGYIKENGAPVCSLHHKLAERSIIMPQSFRRWLDLPTVIPDYLSADKDYDKWAKPLEMPPRDIIKYPHTSYLPFTEDFDDQDQVLYNVDDFIDAPVVITLKMDGSNVVLTNEHVAARNGVDAIHGSFNHLKQIHATIKKSIPSGVQIFGEWLWAKHSIHYTGDIALQSYLQLFGVYDRTTRMWSGWDEVREFADHLSMMSGENITPVQVVSNWTFSKKDFLSRVPEIARNYINAGHEGIVVRSALPFHWSQFTQRASKYVRPHHVKTSEHWKNQPIVRNDLYED
jgi:hypothetical protein